MTSLDLGVVGNCAIASLIDRNGRHVWHGLGRPDGDPVFNALLGGEKPEAGYWEAALSGQRESRQRYLPNTAILETTLSSDSGSVRILDFAPRFRRFGRMFRPPMLVRQLEPLEGRPRLTVRLRPTFEYGATKPTITSGSNHIRYVAETGVLRLTTDASILNVLHEAEFALDRPLTLLLGADESVLDSPDSTARSFLAETESYWWTWVRDLNIPFDWQEAVIRAAITLKLCSFEDTGAVLAALTTSIPESHGTQRNWDYRFSWMRDAFFTVTALNRLSATRTMEMFVRFIVDIVERGHGTRDPAMGIQPLFPIAPGTDTTERFVSSLPGYRGQGPVRVGNSAVEQRQNDVYGSIVMTAAQMFWDERLPRQGDHELYRRLCIVGNEAHRTALLPDAGLWEYRERQEVHTFSATMCWAAERGLGMIARRIGIDSESLEWLTRAKSLREEVLQRSCTSGGWLSGVLDRDMADASSLVLPEIGLLSSGDPRFAATLDMVKRQLMRNGFIMRYVEADDFGKPSNAFLLCTFWYIDALASVGRRDEALELFNNVLSRRNHVGLLAEDVDPLTGEQWGNFPQTYSQVGLILSAMRLSRRWEEGLWHAL